MNILVWIAQGLLVLIFLLTGVPKIFMPIADLIAQGMYWMEDFPVWQIRVIGVLETLAIFGLTLPYVIKILPELLVPLASAGLALTMIGAVVTHIVRSDPTMSIVATSIIFLLCIFVTIKRYELFKTSQHSASQQSAYPL